MGFRIRTDARAVGLVAISPRCFLLILSFVTRPSCFGFWLEHGRPAEAGCDDVSPVVAEVPSLVARCSGLRAKFELAAKLHHLSQALQAQGPDSSMQEAEEARACSDPKVISAIEALID